MIMGAGLFISSIAWGASMGIQTDQVIVDISPAIVQPLQPVEIKVTSYNTDLNRAEVSLYMDGVLVQQGLGLTKFNITAPAVGERVTARVSIRTIDQGTVSQEFTLQPGLVDLLYEATNSYVPTFYEGRKLPAHEGGVRVVAMPYFLDESGRKMDPATLVYTWKIGEEFQTDQSGYGRQILEFKGSPFYRPKTVFVQVESVDGSIIATRSIELPAYDPVIRFYQKTPLWGTDINNAIVADRPLVLSIPEMVIESAPYFFSDSDNDSTVTYDWRMNGQTLATVGNRDIINLRVPASASGQTRINLKINHNDKILQIAESLFTVVFGDKRVAGSGKSSVNTSNRNFFGASQ